MEGVVEGEVPPEEISMDVDGNISKTVEGTFHTIRGSSMSRVLNSRLKDTVFKRW